MRTRLVSGMLQHCAPYKLIIEALVHAMLSWTAADLSSQAEDFLRLFGQVSEGLLLIVHCLLVTEFKGKLFRDGVWLTAMPLDRDAVGCAGYPR
jgi:hypothetical protein